jgi:formylmethanofuran dehydrogenase subunit E
MMICQYTFEEYRNKVEDFHGHLAPGLIIGGFMIDLAMQHRPEGEFFDVLCETGTCLPDAVQILTPCTYGNGWLKVVNVGRFALTLFEKQTGEGIRVYLDVAKLDPFPVIQSWFLKRKPKSEQDKDALICEIEQAGHRILSVSKVRVDKRLIGKSKGGKIAICSECKEAYPVKDGDTCLACQGLVLYTD